MDYQHCLNHLKTLGDEVLRIRSGLETMKAILKTMGNPHLNYPCILVAGTNGKGSTARFISSITSASGLLTGRFSSPHLITVRERICLNEVPVERRTFTESFSRMLEATRSADLSRKPTYFEEITATALDLFSRQKVNLAVLEVGMGGLLDSTNVVEPVLSTITPISIDHQLHLGTTLEEIASQKAGIIRSSRPVLTAPQHPRVARVLQDIAINKNASFTMLNSDQIEANHLTKGQYQISYRNIKANLGVLGQHQIINAALATESVMKLDISGKKISKNCILKGLTGVQPCGVLHPIACNPDIFVDGGHNPHAAKAVATFLSNHTKKPRHLIVSMMKDKDLNTVSAILSPLFDKIDLFELPSIRAANSVQLQDAFPQGRLIQNLSQALMKSRGKASSVLVFGSFQLVGKVLREWGNLTEKNSYYHSI